MRRALLVVVTLLVLSAGVVFVIHLRVTGAIMPPNETAAAPMDRLAKTTIIPATTEDTPAPPPAADGSATPSTPPEGWLWWGRMSFRKDAKIQSNHIDDRGWGYEVPVQYTNEGALVVASKYRDHSACIWSYDTASGKFEVLHRKTRDAVVRLAGNMPLSHIWWEETTPDYTWELWKENGRVYRNSTRRTSGALRGGARDDQHYGARFLDTSTGGVIFQTTTQRSAPIPLNHGALELVWTFSNSSVVVPFVNKTIARTNNQIMKVWDPAARRVLSSMPAHIESGKNWDFGRGLVLFFFNLGENRPCRQRAVLLGYPELRVIALGDLPESYVQFMPSVREGLALDVVANNYWALLDRGAAMPAAGNPRLCRVRVPDDWRKAPGQRNLFCVWEDTPDGLAELEVTELGVFDVARHDAHWFSEVEEDPCPKNLTDPYVWRDGVLYWRKRHTGEVVMASVSDLDAQTVIGGADSTWDGFRLNPARDELVTWRENGEIVFWNVQFPFAKPLLRASVVTDETSHRLEPLDN
ncbi:MAG: hypothetical protein H3C30_12280 [Candidatus Hydrogenedentes bacterium]|nr:hypothetical protein [Candidatus Hydrogenedentota bacterium]